MTDHVLRVVVSSSPAAMPRGSSIVSLGFAKAGFPRRPADGPAGGWVVRDGDGKSAFGLTPAGFRVGVGLSGDEQARAGCSDASPSTPVKSP